MMDVNEPCVMIIDDDESVREALQFLMKSVSMTAKTYSSAMEFIDEFNPQQRGCIVSDIRMPGMSGLAMQEELNGRRACQPIIFITGHGDIAMAVDAIKNGAADFLTKPFRDQDLLDAVNKALAVNESKLNELDSQEEVMQRLKTLTARERQVLELVVIGKANKVIADQLKLSPRTVEVHRSHMMEKMQVRTVAELVKLV
jgi:FixJ family two-component response regulator